MNNINTIQTKYIVVVDAYATGAYIAPTALSFGFPCIHVKNKTEHMPLAEKSFSPQLFTKLINYHGDIDSVLEELKEFDIQAVIPGTESGVILSIALSNALGLPNTSGSIPSSVFRDKYQLYKELGYLQVYSIHKIKKAREVESVVFNEGEQVVVKPTADCSSFCVKICNNIDEVYKAVETVISSDDLFSRKESREAIIMPRFTGVEYMVNTVSHNSIHTVVELWKTNKTINNGSPTYGVATLLDLNDHQYEHIIKEATYALQKLGVVYGPAHIEIIDVDGKTAFVIDFGFRLQGRTDPSIAYKAYGSSALQYCMLSAINRGESLNLSPPKYNKGCRLVTLHARKEGRLSQDFPWEMFSQLPSFHSVLKNKSKCGEYITFSQDAMTSFGTIFLVGSDHQIEIDTQLIKEMEQNGVIDDFIANNASLDI
ncbi:hypothetical protein [Aeromonas veronii]|uniref:hypothetical protein n=1 Tax=Aeromonas veronii TaxID=654 RepID=UPI003BA28A48